MCEGHAEAGTDRERVRDRLRALVAEREALDQRRQDLTDELHRTLRTAHDLGWTWAQIADFAGYRNATVARNQAAPQSTTSTSHPPGTYSVREAAERLGVSTQTIYARIVTGRLEVAEHQGHHTRVYLPDAPSSVDESE